jgi:hypothetical protein
MISCIGCLLNARGPACSLSIGLGGSWRGECGQGQAPTTSATDGSALSNRSHISFSLSDRFQTRHEGVILI